MAKNRVKMVAENCFEERGNNRANLNEYDSKNQDYPFLPLFFMDVRHSLY